MGRTLPTFSMYLEKEMEEWRPFRRALRSEDRAIFDNLFALAKRHMAEAAYIARPVPFDALIMTILLEQQKTIEELTSQLKSRAGHEDPEKKTESQNLSSRITQPDLFG